MGVRFPRPVQIRLQAGNEATHTVFGVPRRVARKNQAPSSNNEKPPAESNTAPTSPLGSAVRPIMEDVQAIVARTAAANNQRLTGPRRGPSRAVSDVTTDPHCRRKHQRQQIK